MVGISIVTRYRRVEIQATSEMTPYFTMTKCNENNFKQATMDHRREPYTNPFTLFNPPLAFFLVKHTLCINA